MRQLNSNFQSLKNGNEWVMTWMPKKYASSDKEINALSLWKLITCYFNSKFDQIRRLNFLILITIIFFDSNWWYSFREINVIKNVNNLCLDQNIEKWAYLVFTYNLFTFQILENVKDKFPYAKGKTMLFPRIQMLMIEKKPLSLSFSCRRKCFICLLYCSFLVRFETWKTHLNQRVSTQIALWPFFNHNLQFLDKSSKVVPFTLHVN